MALLCAVVLAVTGTVPARAQSVDTDAAVVQARAKLVEERARSAALTRDLDAAAGAFEWAEAHRLRLLDEVAAQDSAVEEAGDRLEDADAAFARSIADSYMAPGSSAALVGAVAAAPDTGTALHRAALMERLTVREQLRSHRAAMLVARVGTDARQHQVVRVGASGAAEEAAARAFALEDLLTAARDSESAASSALSEAEQAARARIEEEQRQEAARAAAARAALAVSAGSPMPAVSGKVCPIGAPNGFIDSFGFPRSGGRKHQGVDMFAVYGMPLYAVADGTITRVYNNRLGGLSINLVDGAGDRYYYAHLSSAAVTAGQLVRAGEVIGANGNSGNARTTPPHLHWQYHPGGGAAVNPSMLAAALCR